MYDTDMHGLITRQCIPTIKSRLKNNPAVALLGARQVGKSTIAGLLIKEFGDSLYLDLESASDMNKLTDPEAFFKQFNQSLICLDEIQRLPDIFTVLRSVIDRHQRNSQFLILGSASRDLIRQRAESLAGRLSYIEITPFTLNEVPQTSWSIH